MNSPRQSVDLSIGLIYLVFGFGCAWGSYGYGLGTPARMGAGFFPFWLGVVLGLLGVGAIARAWPGARAVPSWKAWKLTPLLWVLSALGAFAVLLPSFGMVLAIIALVLIASRASPQFTWGASIASALMVSLFCALVFIIGLGLPMPLWPTFREALAWN